MKRVLNDDPPSLSDLGAPLLSRIVHRAMAKNPRERYASAVDFASAIESCLDNPSGTAQPLPAADPHPSSTAPPLPETESDDGDRDNDGIPVWRRRRTVVALALAGVLAGALTGALATVCYVRRPPDPTPQPLDAGPPTVTVNEVGTGDFPTLAAALAALPAGSTINLGPGYFDLDQTLVVDRAIKVVGAGQNATRIFGHGPGPVIDIAGVPAAFSKLTVTYADTAPEVDVIRANGATLGLTEADGVRRVAAGQRVIDSDLVAAALDVGTSPLTLGKPRCCEQRSGARPRRTSPGSSPCHPPRCATTSPMPSPKSVGATG